MQGLLRNGHRMLWISLVVKHENLSDGACTGWREVLVDIQLRISFILFSPFLDIAIPLSVISVVLREWSMESFGTMRSSLVLVITRCLSMLKFCKWEHITFHVQYYLDFWKLFMVGSCREIRTRSLFFKFRHNFLSVCMW